ncbi:MAG: SCP2 sterol-binding domain-containing protein [Promethearchaeota archaeon]
MGIAKENLEKIAKMMEGNKKVEDMFTTNIAGEDVPWNMTFQFNLNNEDPFYLEIKDKKVRVYDGANPNAEIVLIGDNNAIVKICNGKGDFTHAISREEITIEKGKVMDVIRLTKGITFALKSK